MVVLHLKQLCTMPVLFFVIFVGCVIYEGILYSSMSCPSFLHEQQHPNTQHIIDEHLLYTTWILFFCPITSVKPWYEQLMHLAM